MPLDLSIRNTTPDTAVLTLTGQLTLGTSLKITDTQIQALVAKGVSNLVLDLSAVSYIDSAGLGAIVYNYGLTQQHQGVLRVCGLQPRVAELLKMTRTDLYLPIDPDAETSLAAIASL